MLRATYVYQIIDVVSKIKNWIFLPAPKDYNYNLEKTIKKYIYFDKFTIHPIKRTSEPAETCLFAKKLVNLISPYLWLM